MNVLQLRSCTPDNRCTLLRKKRLMKNRILILTTAILANSELSLAHGEDKAGPNGGFIRMPGAFHTELVLEGKNILKVYLLDMQWKNPSVSKASLQIMFSGKKSTKADCVASEINFVCTFPKNIDLTTNGKLSVQAKREGEKGSEVTYPTPLKLEAASTEVMDHSKH